MMKNEVLNFGVHGVFGIGVENSALNAGTDGMLRMNSKGEFYATGTSLKYPMKVLWEQNGEKVLGIRSYKNAKNENIPRSLRERFEYLTDSDVKEFSDDELMKALFTFTDVKNFGCLFLIPNVKNVGIRGAVQIQDGYNKYSDATMIVQDILSCYRNPNEKPKTDNKNSEKKQMKAAVKEKQPAWEPDLSQMKLIIFHLSVSTRLPMQMRSKPVIQKDIQQKITHCLKKPS